MVMRHISAGPQGAGLVLDYHTDVLCDEPALWKRPDDIAIEYTGTTQIRASYESVIAGLGYPQMTRNAAISCGSRTGAPQGVPAGGVMFEGGKDVGVNPIASLCLPLGNILLGFGFYAQMQAVNN